MNIFTYQLLFLLVLPLALLRLLLRGIRQRAYLYSLPQRLGFFSQSQMVLTGSEKVIWIHCVSVGETNAAYPLIEILLKQYPRHHMLISHTTPTGMNTPLVNSNRLHRCYLPFDLSWSMGLFLKRFKPQLGIIMETEIWPMMAHQCQVKKVPLFLINARLSDKSLQRYLRFNSFARATLENFEMICAQSIKDKKNFQQLTRNNLQVIANLKFDFPLPSNLQSLTNKLQKDLRIANDFVVVAGSTREGEEADIINYFKYLPIENVVLVIVPRHPQRFHEVEHLIKLTNLPYVRKSNIKDIKRKPKIILGDTMGELNVYYGLADLVLLGGSLKDFGSQNPIEPLRLGKYVAVGPSAYNFMDVIEKAEKQRLIFRLTNISELESLIKKLMKAGHSKAAQEKRHAFVEKQSGGSKKIAELISRYL